MDVLPRINMLDPQCAKLYTRSVHIWLQIAAGLKLTRLATETGQPRQPWQTGTSNSQLEILAGTVIPASVASSTFKANCRSYTVWFSVWLQSILAHLRQIYGVQRARTSMGNLQISGTEGFSVANQAQNVNPHIPLLRRELISNIWQNILSKTSDGFQLAKSQKNPKKSSRHSYYT